MDQYLNKAEKKRYYLFDSIRGICVLGMVIYHTLFDIAVLGGAGYDASFLKVFDIIRDFGAATFIFLSGICFHYGTHRLRRFIVLFVCGVVVSAVTYFALPEAAVVFGILTFMSVSGALMIPLDKLLKKIPAPVGFSLSLIAFIVLFHVNFGYVGTYEHVIFVMPKALYRNIVTAFFGFPYEGFSSGDYYPLLPWSFIYAAGYFFYWFLQNNNKILRVISFRIPFFCKLGQYSLPVYLIHQPIIFGVVNLLLNIMYT